MMMGKVAGPVYAPRGKRVNVKKAPVPRSRPKLGQHFLRDDEAVGKIVAALGDLSTRTVLEIGPGPGTLTRLLAKRSQRLIAIELDRVLAAQLSMEFATERHVEVIEADILSVDFDTLFAPRPGLARPGLKVEFPKVHLVGNLPYYATSEILLHLFDFARYFDRVVIMVQREVADRLAAKPGSRDYGLLSATTQLHARVEKLFELPPESFNPPPKVHSAVLRLTMEAKGERLGVRPDEFTNFLKLVFAQKRKTLWNNLRARYPETALKAALEESGIKPAVRAEALPLEKTAALFRSLQAAAVLSGK
jgi:16S rRNA (adenine1518-N6/adenine1519-N6)-dimethyltransferase